MALGLALNINCMNKIEAFLKCECTAECSKYHGLTALFLTSTLLTRTFCINRTLTLPLTATFKIAN